MNRSWNEVDRRNPCETCGKTSWCTYSEDGNAWVCRRSRGFDGIEKTDKNGATYFLNFRHKQTRHNPSDAFAIEAAQFEKIANECSQNPFKPVSGSECSISHIEEVYSALLNRLSLSRIHWENLIGRGFEPEHIAGLRYRTMRKEDRERLNSDLEHGIFGEGEITREMLLKTPGFYLDTNKKTVRFCGGLGIYIPVRNSDGRIVALKVRMDTDEGGKYRYVSSKEQGGVGPGSPVHTPNFEAKRDILRITEGEIKADLATVLSDILTLSISGVGNWRSVVDEIRKTHPQCETVRVSLDADYRNNREVAKAILFLVRETRRIGVRVQMEDFQLNAEREIKGIDDAIAKNAAISLIEGDALEAILGYIVDRFDIHEDEIQNTAPTREKEPVQNNGNDPIGVGNSTERNLKTGQQRTISQTKKSFSLDDFENRADGLYKKVPGDRTSWRRISGRVRIEAQYSSPNMTGWGRIFVCENFDGEDQVVRIPDSEFLGDAREVRERLTSLGIKVESPKNSNLYDIVRFIHESDVDGRVRFVDQGGWHKEVFVLPSTTIGIGDQKYRFEASSIQMDSFETSGTLDQWKEQIGSYLSGNDLLTFTSCLAFCGPILPLVGADPFGVHIHGASSIGKSSISVIASSIWGNPTAKKGCVVQWNGTANGFEFKARELNHYFLVLDEIGAGRDADLGKVIYMLGNGIGKVRGSVDETTRKQGSWRLPWLSTGEKKVSEVLGESGKDSTAGHEVRMIELPADANEGWGVYQDIHEFWDSAMFSDFLRSNASKYYGTPIREFLSRLVAKRDDFAKHIVSEKGRIIQDLLKNSAAHGQVFRVADKFALVGAVGELAIDLEILPLTKGDCASAARALFTRWIEERDSHYGDLEGVKVVRKLRGLLERDRFSKFPLINKSGELSGENGIENLERKPVHYGFRRETDRGTEFLIYQSVFKGNELFASGFTRAKKTLFARGYLVKDSGGCFTCPVRLPDIKEPLRMYVIRESILKEPGDSDSAIGNPRSVAYDGDVDDSSDEPLYSL
jgi:uncharacterized protein (DUF927 family)